MMFELGFEDFQRAKEIFYRVEPETEYHSMGYMSHNNPTTGLPYPIRVSIITMLS
jgi:hypothetical protein